MDKIIEISLSKIESSKTKPNLSGKTSALHRHLLVNSVLNRVRCNEKVSINESLMKYREPRSLVDMDIDECDIEKVPSINCKTYSPHHRTLNIGKQTSVPMLKPKDTPQHSNSVLKERNENIPCECNAKHEKPDKESTQQRGKKRHAISKDFEEHCKSRKLRKSTHHDTGVNITNLVSLFDDLVANSEHSSRAGSVYVPTTTVVAC